MIWRGGHPVSGFALGNDTTKRLSVALQEVLSSVESFSRSLTAREQTICRICLSATHLEEAVVVGDFARAQAHADKIVRLLDQLGATR